MAIRVSTVRGVAKMRRAGRAFTREPVEIPIADLTDDELDAIDTEPRLNVEMVDAGQED
jgi:hypothetical protein